MSHGHAKTYIAPSKLVLPAWWLPAAVALTAVGVGAFCYELFVAGDAIVAWKAYLIGFVFFALLGFSGPFFTSTLYVTRAGWSATIRRIPESFGAFILPAGVLGLILIFGGADPLYEWVHPHAGDAVLAGKLDYLNVTRMAISTALVFGILGALSMVINHNSRKQDVTGDRKLTLLNARLSSVYLILMAFGVTVFAVDFIMSQQPHWFSTIWAVNVWSNMFQAGIALSVIITLIFIRKGLFGDFIRRDHLHDLGKLELATTGFWAYIIFCQFMLIWYGNLPEETSFFSQRIDDGWGVWSIVLPALKFLVPFMLLLPRSVKRGKGLMAVSIWIFVMCIYEVWWWVAPAPAVGLHHVHPHLPVIELLVFLGFAGMFMLVVGRELAKHNIIPLKDPLLHEALDFHQ